LNILCALSGSACAHTSSSAPTAFDDHWTPAAGIATRTVLTCSIDGGGALSADTVQPRPDGVHIQVVNALNELVNVGGFDAEPGTTNWVLSAGPGRMDLMCSPFSQHGSGREPTPLPLEIVDPLHLFVDNT
jgi:hypothetical protein